jgi:hypothetical protein
MKNIASVLVVLAVGCDGPSAGVVTIQTTEPPALIAYRDEASATWELLEPVEVGTYEVRPVGPYRVVVACENRGDIPSVVVSEYARTPQDEPLIEQRCRSNPEPFVVRGTMLQEGGMGLGNRFSSTASASWSFEYGAAARTYDLVMVGGSLAAGFDRVAIRRDLAITGNLELGTIDLDQEAAQAVARASFTASNLEQGETRSSVTVFRTGSSFAVLQGAGWDVRLVPEGLLRATDEQRVQLTARASAGTFSRSRTVFRDFRAGDPTAVTLPEELGTVTFEMTADRLAATWSVLPEYDELALVRSSFTINPLRSTTHRLVLTPSFSDLEGTAKGELDLSRLPGWRSEWRLDPATPQTRSMTAFRGADPDPVVSSAISEVIAPAP